jgi:DNA polymerase-1
MAHKDILENLKETPPRAYNDHIMVVDAMNMLIRSFSLLKAMNPDGTHIGGIVGFLRSLGYVTRIFDPTRVIVVWDGKGGSANRKNINPDYKAQRATARITHWGLYDTKQQEMEALIGQLLRVQEYLECLPVTQVQMEKLEADDIMAYIAKQSSNSKVKKCTIISSDKDFLQLVDDTIEVYARVKKKTFTKDNIFEELKVLPENYNIVKSLLGDNSDNLKGVKGLGIKTIVAEFPKLLKEVTNLEYIFKVAEEKLDGKKVFAKIIHNWKHVEDNFQMMDLHDTALSESEIEVVMETMKTKVGKIQIGAFLAFLDSDNIEGITKNTVGWLDNFRGLVTNG